jgi:signal transduction histidine kinase
MTRPSTRKKKYFTDIVNNASNQLLSIITDLINIATIEAGQEKLKTSRVNINQILRNAYNQFEIKATSKQVELECYTPLPDELTFLETDETKLIQILITFSGTLSSSPGKALSVSDTSKGTFP